MAYREGERFLYLDTPAGEDKLLLQDFEGKEGLSQLFDFQLHALAENSTTIDFDKLIGQKVSFGILGAESRQEPRHFNGTVVELSQGARDREFTDYHMRVVPDVWRLTRKFQSRIFQHLNVPDILKKVLAGFDVAYEIQGTFEQREYCTQYRETDFDFVSRLMEEEGIYYFFKYTPGAHKLVLANTPKSHPEIPGDSKLIYETVAGGERDEERISQWRKAQFWGSGKYTVWDHHHQRPHKTLESQETVLGSVAAGKVQHKLKLAGNDGLEVYDYPGRYAQRFDGIDKAGGEKPSDLQKISQDNKRTVGIRMQQTETPMLLIEAGSNCRQITSGHKFTLQRHFNADGQYVCNEVRHEGNEADFRSETGGGQRHYANVFTCLPYELPYRPPQKTGRPLIAGPQTAVVVGPSGEEIFTDKYGRVKVQFHWDREGKYDADSSCWLRVATMWAGKQWGSIFIPRVGHEVVVAFLDGDPDRPLIVGSVYNADTMPSYELPANKTRSGIKSNSSKGSGGFNEIRFEDKKGSEQIFIHGQKDSDTRIENDAKEWIGHDRHLIVERDKYEDVSDNVHINTGGSHMEKITADRHLTVQGKEAIQVQSSHSFNVTGNVAEQFGANHSEQTSGNYYLHASNIVLQADVSLCLMAGSNFISINAAGVTILGMPMVNINSGGAPTPGIPGMLVPPSPPGKALEADKAKAGSEVRYSASGMPPSPSPAPAPAAAAPPAPPPPPADAPRHDPDSEENKKKPHFIALELKDDEGKPVAGEPYEIILPDGSTVASGTTDEQGKARVDGIDPGQCRIRFPQRDQTGVKRQ